MVIQCEKCDTRFRLPDDRLKPQGVKVRCSHCKEVFTVYPPSEEKPAPAPVSEPEPTPPPEASGSDDLDFDSAFSEEEDSGAAGDFDLPEGDDSSAESDDFGFEFDDAAGGDAGQAPNEFAFDENAQDDFSLGDEGGEKEAGSSEFSFDDSTWDEGTDEPEAAEAEAPVEESGVGEGAKDEFSFDEEDWDDTPASSDSSGDSMGGFDSDFGIEDNSALDLPAPASEQGGGDFKFTELEPSSSSADGGSVSEGFGDGSDFGMSDDDLASSVPEPPVRRQKKSSSATLPLLLVLLVVLAGAAGFFLWQQGQLKFVDDLIAKVKGATSIPETSRIEVKSLDHDFVENQAAGSLFVIRGQAFNRFSEKRSSLQVKGELYDGNGRVLASQMVYCGNPLSNKALAGMSFDQIAEAMSNQFGEALSNFEVPPGKGLPFVIVFRDPPANLVEYGVEVVGSQPVAQ